MSDWRNPLPLRILVIADFGATAPGDPVAVTEASYDDVLAGLAPRVDLRVPDRLGGGEDHELTLDLPSTAGFHPDAIVAAIPALSMAADLRAELAATLEEGGDPAAARDLVGKARCEHVRAALEALDGEQAPDAEAVAKALAGLDRVLGSQVDEVVHHPDFQRLEGAWRGLHVLLESVGEAEGVVVEILHAGFAELAEKFREKVFDPEYQGTEIPLSAVLLDFDFDHRAHLLSSLEKIAELAKVLQVALVASTGPGLFGLKTLVHLTALSDLGTRLAAPVYQNLRKFQISEAARWTSLTVNRVLLRNLYEPDVGGVKRLAYSESADGAHPERYLWGRAIWLVGANLARSFAAHGHCAEISGHDGLPFHQGLPVRSVAAGKGLTGWCSVEVPLSEQQAQNLTRLGLTTLTGNANGNFAYFPLVANLFRPRPGALTLDAAISHQLFAGHLTHYALKLLGDAPADAGDAEMTTHFKDGFLSFLGPAGGEESVEVTVGVPEGAEQRTAKIRVNPTMKIQEKEVDLSFELPLE